MGLPVVKQRFASDLFCALPVLATMRRARNGPKAGGTVMREAAASGGTEEKRARKGGGEEDG